MKYTNPIWNKDLWIKFLDINNYKEVYNVYQVVSKGLTFNNQISSDICYPPFLIKPANGHSNGVILYSEHHDTPLFLLTENDSREFLEKLRAKVCPDEDIETWYGFLNSVSD